MDLKRVWGIVLHRNTWAWRLLLAFFYIQLDIALACPYQPLHFVTGSLGKTYQAQCFSPSIIKQDFFPSFPTTMTLLTSIWVSIFLSSNNFFTTSSDGCTKYSYTSSLALAINVIQYNNTISINNVIQFYSSSYIVLY